LFSPNGSWLILSLSRTLLFLVYSGVYCGKLHFNLSFKTVMWIYFSNTYVLQKKPNFPIMSFGESKSFKNPLNSWISPNPSPIWKQIPKTSPIFKCSLVILITNGPVKACSFEWLLFSYRNKNKILLRDVHAVMLMMLILRLKRGNKFTISCLNSPLPPPPYIQCDLPEKNRRLITQLRIFLGGGGGYFSITTFRWYKMFFWACCELG
jgi:hypothetical protein